MKDIYGEEITCIDDWSDTPCRGVTQLRESLSGTGTPIARCDGHWAERLDREDEIRARYPEHAPADFDPYYAGERWDDDY